MINPEQQNAILIEGLRALSDHAGEPMQRTLEEFIGGKGELFETTRAASGRGKKSAEAEIVSFLIKQLNLSPEIAKIIAPILLKLLPSIRIPSDEQSGTEDSEKTEKPPKKPKAKPKTSSRPKTEAKTISKKPKKKTPAKPKKTTSKPKKAASKPKKTTSKPNKAASKPKSSTKRTTSKKKPAKKAK